MEIKIRRPHNWTQTTDSLSVYFPVDPLVKGKEISVNVTKGKITAGLKSQPPIIEGSLFENVNESETVWQVEGNVVTIHLEKEDHAKWPVLINAKNSPADPHSTFEFAAFIAESSRARADLLEVFELLKDAAKRGSEFAQIEVASLYAGHGDNFALFEGIIEPSPESEVEYLQMAVDQNKSGFACMRLGQYYQDVAKSFRKAEQYFMRAAQGEHLDALYYLGHLYRKGSPEEEIKPQVDKTIKIWEKAAELGSARAKYSLGVLYCVGADVERDIEKAMEYIVDSGIQPPLEMREFLAEMLQEEGAEKRGRGRARAPPKQLALVKVSKFTYILTGVLVGLAFACQFFFSRKK